MTYKEIVYMCLDELKLVSDDSLITEEHIIFLAAKYRAALMFQYYKDVKKELPQSAYQTICIDLEESSPYDNPQECDFSTYLRSVQEVPDLMTVGSSSVYPVDYFANPNISLITKEQFKYVGHNKFLKSIIYATLGADHKLYFKSDNPQYRYLKKVRFTGVFEDVEKASKMSCDNNEDTDSCDILDRAFPIEEQLVPTLIQSVVKELSGVLYRPEDKTNNSTDDTGDMANFIARNAKNKSQLAIDA